MKKLILALTMILSTQALAAGGTYCTAETEDLKLEVGLVNGRYFGSPIVPNSSVVITLKTEAAKKATGKNEVRFDHTFEKKEINNWYDLDGEMRLASAKEFDTAYGWGITSFSVKVDRDLDNWQEQNTGKFKVNLDFVTGDSTYNKEFSGEIKCEFE